MQFYSLKQFQVENLNVPGAEVIHSPVYGDIRGSLYESFHILKVRFTTSIDSINGIYPGMKTVYGPVSHSASELIYLVRGKLLVYLFDEKDHSKKDKVELEPGMVLKIPANAIHIIRSLDESTIFDTVRTEKCVNNKNYTLEEFNVDLPEGYIRAPYASEEAPDVDYAILGADEMIGKSFIREIEKRGQKWIALRSKLNQQEGLENELANIKPKVSVVIATGAEDFDDHIKAIDQNVTCKLAAIRICKKLGLHCTVLTTGYMYKSTTESEKFTEESAANNQCKCYCVKTSILFDKLLKATGLDKYCLILRVTEPVAEKDAEKSFLCKIIKEKNGVSAPTTISVLPSLIPLALDMIKDKETGTVNLNCLGTITYADILKEYAKQVDTTFTFEEKKLTYEEALEQKVYAAIIEPTRLVKKFGDKVPKIEDAIQELMKLMKG